MERALGPNVRTLLRSYVAWTVVTVCFWLAVLGLLALGKYRGDLRGLLHVGSEFRHPEAFSGIPPIGPWGYDGQFYATLATDPLLRSPQTPGFVDNPRYRAKRVFLPLLAYLAAAGDPVAATYLYPILCWLLTFAGLAALAALAKEFAVQPWWIAVAGLNVGVAASLTRSTPDAPAVSLLFLAWYLLQKQRLLGFSALSLAAVLTRETTLLGVWALAVAHDRQTKRRRAFAAPLVATAVFLSWSLYLALRFPEHPGGLAGNLGWPLLGLWHKGEAFVRGQGVHFMEIAATVGLFALLLGALRRVSPTGAGPWLVLAGYGALALVMTLKVYEEAFAFTRVLLPLAWAATLLVGQARSSGLLAGGLALQAGAGLSLIHGEFLGAGGVRHVLAVSARALALWFFPR